MMPDPNYLLSEIGRPLGLPELQFDARGFCRLGFDDVIVDLELLRAAGLIVVHASLGRAPDVQDASFYRSLLQMNAASMITGGGSIGINAKTGELSYIDRCELRNLTPELLTTFLQTTIGRIEGWTAIAAERNEKRGLPLAPSSDGTTPLLV